MLLADGVADTVASYLEAVGTISAVGLALFLQVVLVRLRRPKLSVHEMKRTESEDRVLLRNEMLTETGVRRGAEYWLRLRVFAEAKKQGATNVQVQLLRVVRPREASNRAVVPTGPLRWSNVWRYSDESLPNLAPGTWRRFDILQLRWHLKDEEQKLVLPILDFEDPTDEQVLLNDPGDYKIEFVLSADGIEASFWRFSFSLAREKAVDVEALPEKIYGTKLELLESGQPNSRVIAQSTTDDE